MKHGSKRRHSDADRAFARIAEMVMSMTPQQHKEWERKNTERYETVFGTFILVKSAGFIRENPRNPRLEKSEGAS